MKQRFLHIFRPLAALLLLTGLLVALATPSGASGTIGEEDPFHYGLTGLEPTGRLDGDALYRLLFGAELTSVEAEFLKDEDQFSLRYHDRIPADIVELDYKSDWGRLTILVSDYTYTAENGETVTWIPTYVTKDNESVPFVSVEGGYKAVLEDLFHTEDFDVDIHFAAEIAVDPAVAESFYTAPWTMGNLFLSEIVEYENNELFPYREALERYETYQKYLTQDQDRKQYEKDMADFAEKKAEYEAYLIEKQAYDALLSAHNAWVQYWLDEQHYKDYTEFMENDWEQYQVYLLYKDQLTQITNKLNILDSVFTADSHGWRLYASLMGGTVDAVLARQDLLVDGGCDRATIEQAGDSTVKLRRLMKGYAELKDATYASEYERIATLYRYYTENYTALKTEYGRLYGALKALYTNPLVVAGLVDEGKNDHYMQFVGQLYVTATALDDNNMRTSSWTIGSGKGTRTLEQVVEELQRIPDHGDADPSKATMPEAEVQEVIPVEPIERPKEPTVKDPGDPGRAPDVVEEPTEPAFVPLPDLSAAPPPSASHPGAVPTPPAMSESQRSLAEAIRQGTVVAPAAMGKVETLTLETTLSCPISIQNLKTVRFYNIDGSLLWQTQVNYGESVSYQGPDMKREDPHNTYTFLGWMTAEGAPASYSCVTSNLSIYANYRIVPKYYTVTWMLDGETILTKGKYGDMPISPFDTARPSTESHDYIFSGWDKEITPIEGDTAYTGSFTSVLRQYTVTWVTKEGTKTDRVDYGTALAYPQQLPASYVEGKYYYSFRDWSVQEGQIVKGDIVVTANYRKTSFALSGSGASLEAKISASAITLTPGTADVVLENALRFAKDTNRRLTVSWDTLSLTLEPDQMDALLLSGCTRISWSAKKLEDGEFRYTLSYQDSMGNTVQADPVASVQLISSSADGKLFLFSDEEGKSISGRIEQVGGLTLYAYVGRQITILSNPLCATAGLPTVGVPGKEILLDPLCDYGYALVGVRLTYPDGQVEEFSGKHFVMPDSDVTLTLLVEKIMYTVSFYVNGSLYHSAEYALGQLIAPPEKPAAFSDDTYSYTFLGWDPLPTIAMGDQLVLEHHAVFSKNLLQGADPYQSTANNNRLLTVYLPIGAAVLALLIVPWVILKKRKKKKASLASANTRETTVELPADQPALEETVSVPTEEKKAEADETVNDIPLAKVEEEIEPEDRESEKDQENA